MERFYKEEDLINYVKKHGKIEMHDMKELWRSSISGTPRYFIHDCETFNGSCGEMHIFPKRINTESNEVLQTI